MVVLTPAPYIVRPHLTGRPIWDGFEVTDADSILIDDFGENLPNIDTL